jgi:hypothetical protein
LYPGLVRRSTFERHEITPLAVENEPAATLIAIFVCT